MSEVLAAVSPFELLATYEQHAQLHVAAQLQRELQTEWRGIGFRVGQCYFLCGMGEVTEILSMPLVTSVPGTKSWLLGIANIRGNLAAIIDLRLFIVGERTPLTKQSRVILVRQMGGVVGLLIDEILGQQSVSDDDVPLPDQVEFQQYKHYVTRYYEKVNRIWGIFSTASLVQTPDFVHAAV